MCGVGGHVGMDAMRNTRKDVIEAWDCPRLPPLEVPDWELWGGATPSHSASGAPTATGPSEASPPPFVLAEIEKRVEDAARRSFEAGRLQGVEQGRAAEKASCGSASQRLAA